MAGDTWCSKRLLERKNTLLTFSSNTPSLSTDLSSLNIASEILFDKSAATRMLSLHANSSAEPAEGSGGGPRVAPPRDGEAADRGTADLTDPTSELFSKRPREAGGVRRESTLAPTRSAGWRAGKGDSPACFAGLDRRLGLPL